MSDDQEYLISQDEIDALLNGVQAGELNLADGHDESRQFDCVEYDLTNKDHVIKASLPGIDAISERFARAFRASAYTTLRKPTEISINDRQIIPFEEFSKTLQAPMSLTVIKALPLRGSAIIAIEPSLVYLLVDSFFGGNGRLFKGEQDRDYTKTEVNVIGILTEAIIHDLSEAWKTVEALEIEVQGHESNLQVTQITSKSDAVVVCGFNLKTDQGSGDFNIVYPFSMLEPIREKLEVVASGENTVDDSWAQNLRNQVANAHIGVLCNLSTVEMSLRRVLQLRVGDVIPIGEPDKVSVNIEDVACIRGRLGTSKRNLAVSVEQFLNIDEASERAPARTVALLNQINTKRLT